MIDKETIRRMQVKRKAREFANQCKRDNMAYKLPDALIDELTDSELIYLRECLAQFNIKQRKDFYWEEQR